MDNNIIIDEGQQPGDIIELINGVLEQHGLTFVLVDDTYDDSIEYRLEKKVQ